MGKGSESSPAKIIRVRGKAIDVTDFKHPGGNVMLDLGVSVPDATWLFEAYHRTDAASKRLAQLPVAKNAPVVIDPPLEDSGPYPGDSALLKKIRAHLSKIPAEEIKRAKFYTKFSYVLCAILSVIGFAVLYGPWFYEPQYGWWGPFAASIILSFGIVLFALTMFHASNHGCRSSPAPGTVIDFLSAVFATAGPLWRFGHDYSHHSFTNNPDLDNDVFLLHPVLRTRPEYKWRVWHALQYLVVPLGLCIHAFRFPIQNALTMRNPYPPILHYSLMYVLPCYLGYGGRASCVVAFLATAYGSAVSGWLFSVSHNFPGAVDIHAKPPKRQPDWAIAQIEHSCNWGGRISCFFTGGLNYQIEHHLFPSLDPMLYPAVAEFVRKECKDAHVPYVHHPTLVHAVASTFKALWALASPSKRID